MIKTRAAYEEKLAHPEKPWRVIAEQFELKDALELRRAVRRLKEVLKSEGIRIPTPEDYRPSGGGESFFDWRNYSSSPAVRVFGMMLLETVRRADETVLQLVLENENPGR
jgi:hypothetical protein